MSLLQKNNLRTIKIYLFLAVLALLTFSCTTTYDITVNGDYSAHVIYELLMTGEDTSNYSPSEEFSADEVNDLFREFYASDQISNLSVDSVNEKWKVEFDIQNIDSLGNYLDPFEIIDEPVIFAHTDYSLVINGSDGKSSSIEDICGCSDLMKVKMNLKFSRQIKNVVTNNTYVTKADDNTIVISTSIGEMNFSGEQNRLEVLFQ